MTDQTNKPSRRKQWGCVLCLSLLPVLADAAEWLPLNLSGNLGYNLRIMRASGEQETTSNQLTGSLFANSYVWRPWFATTDLGLTIALDQSRGVSDNAGEQRIESGSNIMTGSWNLNLLPQSRTPFMMRYAATDTRVDSAAIDADAFVVLGGLDSKARKLGLQQSLVSSSGHRLMMNYDNNRWYSEQAGAFTPSPSYYHDTLAGVQGELLGKQNRLALNARRQEATYSQSDELNTNNLVDLAHYYYPTRAFRLDTRASVSNIERSFEVPSSNLQSGVSTSDITQFSTYGFWRPEQSRWASSGGVRVYDFGGDNQGLNNEAKNLTVNGGTFYQYNKALRFDASAAYLSTESNGISQDVSRGRLGSLYQSDLRQIRSMTYQWYGNGSIDHVSPSETDAYQNVVAGLGHNASRLWPLTPASSLRLSLGQAMSESYLSTEEALLQHRLDHTASFSWNHAAGGSSSYAQTTLSDRRVFGDEANDQQLFNFQVNRTQQFTRRNSLAGNLTYQRVLQDFGAEVDDSAVTTATGRIDFRSNALFGVPRLAFTSSWLLSRESDDRRISRQEWGNRLDYLIGQLSTSLTHRYIAFDDREYQLLYFSVLRNF